MTDHTPGVDTPVSQFADQGIDNFLVCALEFSFAAFVALFIFLLRVECDQSITCVTIN